jgi:hypothetical protein
VRKRITARKPQFVTGYDIDVDAVAAAMLRDDDTRRLIRAWVRPDGSSPAMRRVRPPA